MAGGYFDCLVGFFILPLKWYLVSLWWFVPETTPYHDFRWTTQIESVRRFKPHQIIVSSHWILSGIGLTCWKWSWRTIKCIFSPLLWKCLQKCMTVWPVVIEFRPHISHKPKFPLFLWGGGMEAPNMINVQYGPLIVWPRQPLNYTAQFEGSKLPKAFKLLMINCEEALW